MGTATVTFILIAGPRHVAALPTNCPVADIVQTVEQAFGATVSGGCKVVLRGAALALDNPKLAVALKDGDHLLVAPQRKAPPPDLVAAVTHGSRPPGASRHGAGGDGGDDGDDDDELVALPPGAYCWEAAAVDLLRSRARCPDWVLDWVVLLRPLRLALFALFLLGCVAASRVGLGPVFMLVCMIGAIFSNLGTRRAGEMSAYSIFNRGVRRLPGQLDADEIDRQMRQGQLG